MQSSPEDVAMASVTNDLRLEKQLKKMQNLGQIPYICCIVVSQCVCKHGEVLKK